jgi:hypothetical protein
MRVKVPVVFTEVAGYLFPSYQTMVVIGCCSGEKCVPGYLHESGPNKPGLSPLFIIVSLNTNQLP